MLFLDTETIGKTSPLLSIQWAKDGDKPQMVEVWKQPVEQTLKLIEDINSQVVCAWNLDFDWFQLVKWYNIFRYHREINGNGIPDPVDVCIIDQDPPRDWCLKPVGAFDLMIYAQKGPTQYLMRRGKPIVLRKVPDLVAYDILAYIQEYEFPQLPGVKLHAYIGKVIPKEGFVDILIFIQGSLSLKHVHKSIIGDSPGLKAKDVFTDFREYGTNYRPWGGEWGGHVRLYQMRGFNDTQRWYALNDIKMMQDLANHWQCQHDPADDDHALVPHHAAVRWKGFSLDIEGLNLKHRTLMEYNDVPTGPDTVRHWMSQYLDKFEQVVLAASTNKAVLKQIEGWDDNPAAADAAKRVRAARHAKHVRGAIRKLLSAGSFHPQMKVSGTLTDRSAGGGSERSQSKSGGSINPQGIDEMLRLFFTFAYEGESMSGGDFDAFEPSIGDAVWRDPRLHELLLSGQKYHAIYGARLFARPYEAIRDDPVVYKTAKICALADMYGGTEYTISKASGLAKDVVARRRAGWRAEMKQLGAYYRKIESDFRLVDAAYRWANPKQVFTTILGFKRKFDVEIAVAKMLFDFDPPKQWDDSNLVQRVSKRQSLYWAVKSCVASALHAIYGRICRIAGNCGIQSVGAQLTKMLQRRLWDLQPTGIHEWQCRTLNIHDELVAVHQPAMTTKVYSVVQAFIEEMRSIVPLLGMDWRLSLHNWSELKDEEDVW